MKMLVGRELLDLPVMICKLQYSFNSKEMEVKLRLVTSIQLPTSPWRLRAQANAECPVCGY